MNKKLTDLNEKEVFKYKLKMGEDMYNFLTKFLRWCEKQEESEKDEDEDEKV